MLPWRAVRKVRSAGVFEVSLLLISARDTRRLAVTPASGKSLLPVDLALPSGLYLKGFYLDSIEFLLGMQNCNI